MLACGIFAPLVLGLHSQESQVLDKINLQILASGKYCLWFNDQAYTRLVPKYDEHRWRLVTHACYTHEENRYIES